MRTVESSASKDVQVRLEPPRVAVLSTHHYVNHGGSEMVVYRATPADVESGVRVGDVEYPGFPAPARGDGVQSRPVDCAWRSSRCSTIRISNTPMRVFARDEAGNQARRRLRRHASSRSRSSKSRIEIDDAFLDRVVPAILELAGLKISAGAETTLAAFLKINGELRRMNAEQIATLAQEDLARDAVAATPFSRSATRRSRRRSPTPHLHLQGQGGRPAGPPRLRPRGHRATCRSSRRNRGMVLNADGLGIYGNCVIIDHGMGVQSLYGAPVVDRRQGRRHGREGAGSSAAAA